MNEFQLIEHYFKRRAKVEGVALGVGDDCALLRVPEGMQLAVSIDTLVAGVHFFEDADPEAIAQRAVRVAVSDLAAMGAEPRWMTLALTLPSSDSVWLAAFSRGLWAASDELGCALVGGDTTKGPLTISVQVHGVVPEGQALVRSGARPGDAIFVSGTLGDGAAALAMLKQQFKVGDDAERYLDGRFYRPVPRVALGQIIRGLATSAIDISDGLLADLTHICRASEVGAQIDVDKLPISNAVCAHTDVDTWCPWALSGGDDYELCFTLAQKDELRLREMIEQLPLDISVIGSVVGGSGIHCFKNGQLVSVHETENNIESSTGYRHF